MGYLRMYFAFLLATIVIVSCHKKRSQSHNATNENSKKVILQLEPGEDNPRNSEGDFIELDDGRLLFVYTHFTGDDGGDHSPAHLAGRYSKDSGKNWSDDHLIVGREGDMNVMSVSLLRLQNGDIALFYAQKNSTSDLIPMMRISTDEAESWSDPVAVITDREGYFVLNNDRVIQLQNGRLLVPVSLHNTPGTEWSNTGRLWSYYSDDNGRTWQSSEEVANPDNIMLQEPGLVELKDGRIMMFIRTDEGVQYLSYSNDKGKTWTPVEPSKIPSPRSPASIERIPSTGDLLMIWNNNGLNQNRTPYNSAISQDEGETWTHIRTIEDHSDGWYCYTAIHFTEDEVVLGHCAGNRPKGTGLAVTNITKLNLNWIYGQSDKKL